MIRIFPASLASISKRILPHNPSIAHLNHTASLPYFHFFSNDLAHTVKIRFQRDLKRHGTPTAQTVVFLEIHRPLGNLHHFKSPQHAANCQPDLRLGNNHAWANTSTSTKHPVIPCVRIREVRRRRGRKKIFDVAIRLLKC